MVGDQATRSARLRVLLIIVLALGVFAVFLWMRGRRPGLRNDTIDFSKDRQADSNLQSPQPTASSSPVPVLSPVPTVAPTTPSSEQTPYAPNVAETPTPENNQ